MGGRRCCLVKEEIRYHSMFKKVLIANRGEIAVRVMATCRQMGIRTVAVYSEADRNAKHVRVADEAYYIGPAPAAQSYLCIEAIIEAARKSGAEAIHPGYGFLSENPAFVEACEQAGMVFIGPPAVAMRLMGSKIEARRLAQAVGTPTVPGYNGQSQENAALLREAKRIGFPVLIKASAGGGGKGMREVYAESDFLDQLAGARREALASFGDSTVFLEKLIGQPRHVEIQVLGDRYGTLISLGERECSIQRRHQKIVEESPSVALTPELRARMGEAAVRIAKAAGYVNAGTMEFMLDTDGQFYFLEMNTRLQVEHPVTELVSGLDLVRHQLLIAAGQPLGLTQEQIFPRGHAIEVRLYAEDPEQNFLPGSGKIEKLALPQPSKHVRIDAGVDQGDSVSIFYDPMIAKLIVWDEDRPRALARMREALTQCEVVGPKCNTTFLERLVRHRSIVDATIDTGYLDRHLDELLTGDAPPSPAALFAAATAVLLEEERAAKIAARDSADPHSPWNIVDGWRLGHAGKRIIVLAARGQRYEVEARGFGGNYDLWHASAQTKVRHAHVEDGWLCAQFDDEAQRMHVAIDSAHVRVHADGGAREVFARASAFAFEARAGEDGDRVLAPMPGRIVLVKAKAGDEVQKDQELLVMEAMKMELTLRAPRAGKIEAMNAAAADFVEADAVLVKFE